MSALHRWRRPRRRVASVALAALVVLLTGCASAATTASSAAGPGGTSSMSGMAGMAMTAAPAATSAAAAAAASAGGVNPVPTQVLGTAVWQGMKISAQAMTAVPFLIYNGTSMQKVTPPPNVSFHLMVTLSDAQTGVAIPYASVWGTITKDGKTPFDESLWPMISRYMGPHYGNNVVLPGAGTYRLSLLVSPPVSARHVEYQDVWLKPHRVSFRFRWNPAS